MSTEDRPFTPRTLILCFDGTGGLYGQSNSNVVKLFGLFDRDSPDRQLVYYQPGVGTYEAPGIMGGLRTRIAMVWDEGVAWYLDAHVMGGYTYLMQNYMEGDRICLFGFSRGAYTARALAGMLYKVGLLPRDNEEQIGLAYKMYKGTGKSNAKLSQGFRQTFSRLVKIEFMGCWDTVSSVGLFWGRHLPFSASTTIIKRFRHALSLDEHRARFLANTWHRNAPDPVSARGDPESASWYPSKRASDTESGDPESSAAETDVLEVWFSGCHSDVGGGATPSDQLRTLGNVSLRWMVREIIDAQCGILFDNEALARADIPTTMLNPSTTIMHKFVQMISANSLPSVTQIEKATTGTSDVPSSPLYGPDAAKLDAEEATLPLNDSLQQQKLWWLLEILPYHQSWQDEKGSWHNEWRWNLGRGRSIATQPPNIHVTVQQRMQTPSLNYIPKASWVKKPVANWVV